jgi:hypothetical protein
MSSQEQRKRAAEAMAILTPHYRFCGSYYRLQW